MSEKEEKGYAIFDKNNVMVPQSFHSTEMESWYMPIMQFMLDDMKKSRESKYIDCMNAGPLYGVWQLRLIEEFKSKGYSTKKVIRTPSIILEDTQSGGEG